MNFLLIRLKFNARCARVCFIIFHFPEALALFAILENYFQK